MNRLNVILPPALHHLTASFSCFALINSRKYSANRSTPAMKRLSRCIAAVLSGNMLLTLLAAILQFDAGEERCKVHAPCP